MINTRIVIDTMETRVECEDSTQILHPMSIEVIDVKHGDSTRIVSILDLITAYEEKYA